MKTKTIKSLDQLFKLLEKCRVTNRFKFRGQSNSEWDLIPKCGREGNNIGDQTIFKQWKRRALHYLERKNYNEYELLAIAQHTGLPTRMLDWSQNPMIALFFACSENEEIDGALYIIQTESLLDIETFNDPFKIKDNVAVYQPTTSSNRIANQLGYFTIHSDPKNTISKEDFPLFFEKYIIPKSIKLDIILMLHQFGINYLSIYPDLEGLSKHLTWFSENIVHFNNDAPDLTEIFME